MSQLAQQIVTPKVTDPNHIAETFVNGPFSLNINNGIAVLTFTTARPDLQQSMSGKQATDYEAPVTLRVAMPLNMLVEVRNLLQRSVQEQPIAAGSMLRQ